MISRQLMLGTCGLFVGVFVLITGLIPSAFSSSKWVLDSDFENNQDKSALLWEKDGISLVTCGSLCNQNQSCLSFFYHPYQKKCLGSKSYKRGLPAGQAILQDWKYYTKPQQCDGDYVLNQSIGLCYKIHYEKKNFGEATAACETEQAKLIIIKNRTQFHRFQSIFNVLTAEYSAGVWIGVRAINDTGDWNWWNGRAASYLPWGAGQPDPGFTGGVCIMIYKVSYHDWYCHAEKAFLCQRYV